MRLIAIAIAMLLALPVLAEDDVYELGAVEIFTESVIGSGITEDQVQLGYMASEDWVFIVHEQAATMNSVVLNEESRRVLAERLAKYEEWRKQAIDQNVTLTKEIGTFPVEAHVWSVFDMESNVSEPFDASVIFFSQSESSHQVILSFPTVSKIGSSRSTNEMTRLYFDQLGALTLSNLIDQNNITYEVERQQEIEGAFQ